MKSVKVYTTLWCGYCNRAKSLLSQKGVDFEEIDLSQDHALRQEVSKRAGMMTVPMIFIGEECIGGYDELSALDRAGELDGLLAP